MKNLSSRHLFVVFLVIYLGFLIYHAISEFSLLMVIGIALALFTHARKNIVTLIILTGHMAIESFEWGSSEIMSFVFIGNLIHSGMDFVFLHHEIKVHLKKNPVLILSGVFLLVIFVFSIASQMKVSEEIIGSIHPFVLGGVIGCVASHIYFHVKKE